MAENPWKKQADVNKAVVGSKPPGGTPPVAPWMKNKAEQQPPAQSTEPQQQSQPVPPIKPPVPPVIGGNPTGGSAPWMKPGGAPQQNNVAKPPTMPTAPQTGATGATGAPGGSVPPWMKNKPTTSPLQTDRKAEEQKHKQEEQARAKKLKQEQQQKVRKEAQLKRQEKQRQRMLYEEKYSQIREQEDKKKKPLKSNKKSSPKKLQSKKSPSSSMRNLSQPKTIFHKYLASLSMACSKQQQYRQKLEYQKDYVQVTFKYTEEIKNSLMLYLRERKIVQRKKNVINLENIIIEYALVEGMNNESGSANPHPYFKTKNIQYLQEKFSAYSVLYHAIVRLIKKSSIFRLRVPLFCRASFKGIQFLCEGVCDELLDCVLSPVQNFMELQGELMQLEKQLRDCGHDYINRKTLTVKKIATNNEEYYILYLVENFDSFITKQNAVSNRVSFYPNVPLTIDSLINLSLISTKKLGLTYSIMKSFSELKKNTTSKFQECYLNLFQISHAIRVVYASCQGEVEDQSFWSLIFDDNRQIWELIKGAYQGIYGLHQKTEGICKLKNKFLLAKIIQMMVPVNFAVGRQKTIQGSTQQIKKKPIYLESNLSIKAYPLDALQVYQISQLYDKTIQNPNKIKISEDAQQLQEEINRVSEELYVRNLTKFVNKNNLKFQKGLLSNSIELAAEAIANVENYEFTKGKEMDRIMIYPLLMKFYISALELGHSRFTITKVAESGNNESETTSNRFEKSKLQESQVKQVYFTSDGPKKEEEPKEAQPKKQEDFETKLIRTFGQLLGYVEELFEDEKQVWIHAGLYMILASYYSKPNFSKAAKDENEIRESSPKQDYMKKLSYFNKTSTPKQKTFSKSHALDNSKNRQSSKKFDTQSMASEERIQEDNSEEEKIQHPYRKQCMKFIQLAHRICLQYYGSHSSYMAQFLFHEAEIYYNINELDKCQSSVQQALKIYRSSSKNAKNLLNCSSILGKSLVQRGRLQKDNKVLQKGIEILQNTAEELFNLGMQGKVIEVYQFLCVNFQFLTKEKNTSKASWDGNKYVKIEHYLQKMADMAFHGKNIDFLKKVIRKAMESEITFYSKERAIALKDLHDRYVRQNVPQDQDQRQKLAREEENMVYLEENRLNFGGLLELIKWSFGILKSKGESLELTKAMQIMEKLLGFFTERQILQILGL